MIAGFTSIANIDISRVVIDQMIERYREKNTMTCRFPFLTIPPRAVESK